MRNYIENVKRYKPLLIELVIRDIKNRYRKSVLGVFWTLLNPLLMMIVLSVVFSNLFKFNIEHYPVYILSGQVIFNFFSESTNDCMISIINNASLIKKIYVPKYMFVISRIFSSIINVMAAYAALIIVMLFMRMDLHYSMILSFIPIIFLILFSSGIGFLLSSFSVKFRDIIHFYSVFLTALMYLMPVIYPIQILDGIPVIKEIVTYNPLTIILTMFRDLVMNNTIPGIEMFLLIAVISFAVLALGMYVFYKKQDSFIMDL